MPDDYLVLFSIVWAFLNEYINYVMPIWTNIIKNVIHQYVMTKCSPIIYKCTGFEPVYLEGSITIPATALSFWI